MRQNLIEAGQGLRDYIDGNLPYCEALYPFVLAQMVHESGWGKSELCRNANNFGGLKYREEIKGYSKYIHTDWEGEESLYFACESPREYARLYFKFICRSVYDGWYRYRDDGAAFIAHLESCGYCASTPGDKSYTQKILDIVKTDGFQELLEAIELSNGEPEWLKLYRD